MGDLKRTRYQPLFPSVDLSLVSFGPFQFIGFHTLSRVYGYWPDGWSKCSVIERRTNCCGKCGPRTVGRCGWEGGSYSNGDICPSKEEALCGGETDEMVRRSFENVSG